MELSIGDFAEQLMKQGKTTATVASVSNQINEQAQAPDISNVVVPDIFIDQICKKPKKDQVQKPVLESVQEDTSIGSDILLEIRDLLLGLREQINEMTTAGSIGMGAYQEKSKDVSIDKKLKDILAKKKRK